MKIKKHIFICVNQRPPQLNRNCCADRGGLELRAAFKETASRMQLTEVKVTASGCLGPCDEGVNVVVYPDGVWYKGVAIEDVEEIFSQHIIGNKPVVRLLNQTFRRPI